jgi:hypothetical protein
MKIKALYEIFSLISGVGATLTITFFLLTSWPHCIILFESYWFIRIPEIIIGLTICPYYVEKIVSCIFHMKELNEAEEK